MFNVGDYAISPNEGLVQVKRIEQRTVSGKQIQFYIVESSTKLTIFVPVTDTTRLRPISTAKQIKDVLNFLIEGQVFLDESTWNKRYKNCLEMISTGSIFSIAQVYKTLLVIRQDRDLSYGERKMLDLCKTKLAQEIGIVLDLEESKALKLIAV